MKKRSARLIAMGLVMGMFVVSVPEVNAADTNVGVVSSEVNVQKEETVSEYEESAVMQGRWIKSGNRWWFRFEDGSYPKNVMMQDTKGHVYAFDKEGWMVTGWYKDNEPFEIGGRMFCNWYYFDNNGYMVTGWRKINNVWYYFDKEEGWMYFWDVFKIDGAAYYFKDSGAMLTGWCYDEFYDEWYYASASGKLLTGWQWIGDAWYYFDENDYFRYSDGIAEIEEDNGESQFYAFDENGRMVRGWYKQIWEDGTSDWLYFNKNGTPRTGWVSSGGKWYWIDDGVMNVEEYHVTDGGKISQFRSDGSGVWIGYVK